MIKLKTEQELILMKESGRRLRIVVDKLKRLIRPGITTIWLDQKAERLIKSAGGEPSFKKVSGYRWSTCLCVNEQVVHTPPSNRVLKEGDVLTLDVGMFYRGWHTDYAESFVVGKNTDWKIKKFLKAGKLTLNKAIEKVKIGHRLGEVSQTIEQEIKAHGYHVIKELTGHGIGRRLHEDPIIPGFLDKPIDKTMIIKDGLTVAIEVIYCLGKPQIVYEDGNRWSLMTFDRSLSACFEHTVAVTDSKTIILT